MKLLPDGYVELTADDLRFTESGMPCMVPDGENTWTNFRCIEYGFILDRENMKWDIVITLISDWRKYTARTVFALLPDANWITRGTWWWDEPKWYGYRWLSACGCKGDLNLPDLWPERSDEEAIISRKEVEGEK